MTDKFGLTRGRRGPRGFPGEDALQFHLWFPESLFKLFQASATCLFYFNSGTDGILFDESGKKPIGLKNRSEFGENNAICSRGVVKPTTSSGKTFSLNLSTDNCFEIPKLTSALKPSSVFVVAFSFKLKKPIKDELSYYIFSNANSTRAVTLRKNWLDIAGCFRGSPQLVYKKTAWNYMLIQYSRVSEEGAADRCFFILNGRKGFFEPVVYENDSQGLYIGHKIKKCANIELNYFMVHSRRFEKSVSNEYTLPEVISTLLLKDMKSRLHTFEKEEENEEEEFEDGDIYGYNSRSRLLVEENF